MTDSAINNEGSGGEFEGGPYADGPSATSERAFEGNPTATELFDDGEETFTWDPPDRANSDGPDGSTQIQDQTASDVFGQLQTDVDDDEILSEETPEDIIAAADEPTEEPEIDDSLLADDELTDLLLTGRTEQKGFQWIENEESADGDGAAAFDWIDDDSDKIGQVETEDADEEAFDWVEDDDDDTEFDWIEDDDAEFDWIDTDGAGETIDGDDTDDVTIGWGDTDAVATIGWSEAADQADRSSTERRDRGDTTVSMFSWGG